jgi:hypothetical protein
VTARAVEAGAQLTAADVAVVRIRDPGTALAGTLTDPVGAVGHIVRLALPAGTVLSPALLAADPGVATGRRRLDLRLDAAAAPTGLQAGDRVDVLAAVADAEPGGGGRVLVVTEGSVVAVGVGGPGSSATGPPQLTVTLDVAAAAAARVLWVEAFARTVILLRRPTGDGVPLVAASGPAP